ncbi:MAG: hypothetical protein ABI405_08745 [Parafilimonas sp.]
MKFLTLLGFILCCSCSKTAISINKDDLAGTWVLRHISGEFAGIDSIPADRITIAFETSGKYTTAFNYAITDSGNYTITKAGEPNYYYSEILLNLISDSNQITYGMSLKNDSLGISEGCCDQFGYLYIKQK